MKYFRPTWTWFPEPTIEGDHHYALPLVECPICKNSKSESGLTYPWINLESIFEAQALRRMRTTKSGGAAGDKDCSWEEYKSYWQVIREKIGAEYQLPPGVRFGEFFGKVFDPPENFVLTAPCCVLANRSVVKQLMKDGFSLKTFDTKLKSKKEKYDYVELWAPTMGWAAEVKYCKECERGDIGGTKVPIMRGESIPSDAHLFRLKDALNFIIFSEALVDTILETGFTGIKFTEIQTS